MNGKKCRKLRKLYYGVYDALWSDIRHNEKMSREKTNVRYDNAPDNADRRLVGLTFVNPKDSARRKYRFAKSVVYGFQLP